MPTYDYRCENCGRFEFEQRITEPVLTECPTCGQAVERLISRNVAIVFKGSGFYCTDNRNDGDRDQAGAAKKDKAKKEEASATGEKVKEEKAAAATTE